MQRPFSAAVRLSCLLSLLLTGPGCGHEAKSTVIRPPGGATPGTEQRQDRQWLDPRLSEVARIGTGSERDTTFTYPYLLLAQGGRLFVMEAGQVLRCYDSLGRELWRFGRRGGGPKELRNVRDLKVGPAGSLLLLDPENARITRLGLDGRFRGSIPLHGTGYSERFVPGRDRIALFPNQGEQILYLSYSGERLGADSIPWEAYGRLENLARQHLAPADPRTGKWVFSFTFGNGWFAFDSLWRGSPRRLFVEPTPFPTLLQRREGNTIVTEMVRTPHSAAAATLLADTLVVLFDGGTRDRRRTLDLYAWGTGAYLGSWRLPEETSEIAIDGPLLYLLTMDPTPRITIYRRAG